MVMEDVEVNLEFRGDAQPQRPGLPRILCGCYWLKECRADWFGGRYQASYLEQDSFGNGDDSWVCTSIRSVCLIVSPPQRGFSMVDSVGASAAVLGGGPLVELLVLHS